MMAFPTLYHQIAGGLSASEDMICKEQRLLLKFQDAEVSATKHSFLPELRRCSSRYLGSRCKASQGGSHIEDTGYWNFPAHFPSQ